MRSFLIFVILSCSSVASAQAVPFLVLREDSLQAPITNYDELWAAIDPLVSTYARSGQPIPEILSVWTAYPMGGNSIATFFVPLTNDVTGIGLSTVYSPETFAVAPPLRAVLLHNDFTALAARAEYHRAPVAGYARYLFLLELSHLWGPALQIPGESPGALIGFPFHWSFFMDAGGSPAGGNVWSDGGDGTFTVVAQDPSAIRFSMLDLYAMGLATPDEVAPFGLLTDVVVPPEARDPLNGGSVRAATFPWMSAELPLTVRATRREITIEDVIAANGTRTPAAADAPHRFTLGIVLVVASDASETDIARLGSELAPIAGDLAPAFFDATRERAELSVVTASELPAPSMPDAGVQEGDAGRTDGTVDAGVAPPLPPPGCGCMVTAERPLPHAWALLLLAACVRRRRRSALGARAC